MLFLLDALDLRLERSRALRDHLAEPGGLCLKLAVAEILETLFVLVNRIHDRLDALQLAVESRPEDLGEQTVCHIPLAVKPPGRDVLADRLRH